MRQVVQKLIDEATLIMSKSKDILHDKGHVKRMINDWNVLLGKIDEEVNCEVVVLAICWHDTWLATVNLPGVLGTMIEYVYEGIGSMLMFNRAAKRVDLDQKTRRAVAYTIKNHPGLPTSRHKTIEAKILWDIDNLETWSWERLVGMYEENKSNKKMIAMAKTYFEVVMKKRTSDRLYFEWSRKEFDMRKETFLEKIRQYEKDGLIRL
jgi:hypothetical protein